MNKKSLLAVVVALVLPAVTIAQAPAPKPQAAPKTAIEKMSGLAAPADVQSQQQKLKELAPEFQKLLKDKGVTPMGMDCKTVCTAKVIIGPDGKPQTVFECSLVCN